jgi:hypothetical protein
MDTTPNTREEETNTSGAAEPRRGENERLVRARV